MPFHALAALEGRPHEQPHLVFRRLTRRAPLDVEALVVDPGGQTEELALTAAEGEPDVVDQRLIGRGEQGAGQVGIAWSEREP